MSEMPERIWARWLGLDSGGKRPVWVPHMIAPATEYVRADIYEALRTRFEAGATAEVQRLKHLNDNAASIVAEKDAEIERLRKALEQAVQLANIRLEYRTAHDDPEGDAHPYVCCDSCGTPFMSTLAAYLRERDNRPPDRVVQNVVQNAGEGGGTDV